MNVISRIAIGASAAVLLSATLPVQAHHSFPATYLVEQSITIKGKVTEFMFRNPHSVVQVLAPDDKGQMVRWAVEWAAAAALSRDGKASRDLLHPGDEVIVTGAPGRHPEDHKIRLYTIERPADGWKWSGKYN
jgi:Family of unknown function (DUF6152)